MDLFGNLGLTFGFCLYQNGDGRLYVDQNGSCPPQSQVLPTDTIPGQRVTPLCFRGHLHCSLYVLFVSQACF